MSEYERLKAQVDKIEASKYDKAWDIIRDNPELALARQKLSVHELRHIIRAVAQAFAP